MTTTDDLSLPAGADWADAAFSGEGEDRGRLFKHPNIAVGEVTLFILGVQYVAGDTSRSVSLRVGGATTRRISLRPTRGSWRRCCRTWPTPASCWTG
jgi:hypothetical protein